MSRYNELVTKTILANKDNYGGKRSLNNNMWLVIHYTAVDNDKAINNAKYFQTAGRKASANFFVDDNDIVLSVELDNIAYHVGGSRYNDYNTTGGAKYYKQCLNMNSIGIEMCDTLHDGIHNLSNKTRENTIKLASAIMKDFNIPLERVIRHFDVTGKYCPVYYCLPYGDTNSWLEFKKDLINYYNTDKLEEGKDTINTDIITESNLYNHKLVKVEVNDLNIRSTPEYKSDNSNVVGICPRGIYTITQANGNWLKLKSGVGWINARYTVIV